MHRSGAFPRCRAEPWVRRRGPPPSPIDRTQVFLVATFLPTNTPTNKHKRLRKFFPKISRAKDCLSPPRTQNPARAPTASICLLAFFAGSPLQYALLEKIQIMQCNLNLPDGHQIKFLIRPIGSPSMSRQSFMADPFGPKRFANDSRLPPSRLISKIFDLTARHFVHTQA